MNEIWNKIATDQKFEFHNESKSKQTIVKTVENKVTWILLNIILV